MAPYTATRYHLKEFRTPRGTAVEPRNAKELFNRRHSSKRVRIEQTFGIFKRRFRALRVPREGFSLDTQVNIVYALAVIHNFLNRRGQVDHALDEEEEEPQDAGEGLARNEDENEEAVEPEVVEVSATPLPFLTE